MNVGTVSYGTGRFRAIGSLSEAVIVDFYGTGDLQPEKRLMLAVCNMRLNALRNMPNTIVSLKKPKNGLFEDDHEWPFSFINICDAVDMDSRYLRQGLLHWRQSAIPEAITLWPAIAVNKGSAKRCA